MAISDLLNSEIAQQQKLLSSFGESVLPLLHARLKKMRMEQIKMITRACAGAIAKHWGDPDMRSARQELLFQNWVESGDIEELCKHLAVCGS